MQIPVSVALVALVQQKQGQVQVQALDSTDAVPKKCQTATIIETCGGKRGNLMKKRDGMKQQEYEQRTEKFNIHGCWEWSNGEVIIYELPSMPHEVIIGAVTRMLLYQCNAVAFTNTEIYSFGATTVTPPNGSDRNDFPWPNLVVEVAYTETLDHVEEALHYWLSPCRAHDCIIVKIDPVPQGQVPVRMRAWHYCVSAGRGTRNIVPLVTMFEFGTQDGTGTATNINQGQCIINISLSCLYHELKPPTRIPQNLPDPIPLDFYFAQRAVARAFNIH
ncbi:5711_t:CDS:2 [Diversispora eburnea]|uniref:5711_t:CDS:1 n=1 Tax=Diversispora eburnea TaxID=1213867 RepID=A0A9N8Z5G8_9GLOM|nr:5711_t:CDS:2 [Diversispora eburnea]